MPLGAGGVERTCAGCPHCCTPPAQQQSRLPRPASRSLPARVRPAASKPGSRPLPLPRAGTEKGMQETFGSTCHGAGRARSRNNSRNKLDYQQVLDALKTKGIAIRWGRAARLGAAPNCSHASNAGDNAGRRRGTVPPALLGPRPATAHVSALPQGGLPQASHGGGPRELQGRERGGGHLPRRRHLKEGGQAAPCGGGERLAGSTPPPSPCRLPPCPAHNASAAAQLLHCSVFVLRSPLLSPSCCPPPPVALLSGLAAAHPPHTAYCHYTVCNCNSQILRGCCKP